MLSVDHQITDVHTGQNIIRQPGRNGPWDNGTLGEAYAAFNQLNKTWTSKKLTVKTKICFYDSSIFSTLHCNIWHQKSSQEKKRA